MPFTSELPRKAAATLASQLSDALPPAADLGSSASTTVKVAESFQVWSLAADRVRTGSADLADLAVDTGFWHHQILADGRPRFYARSRSADDPDDLQLTQVFESPMAAKFDAGIRWIEAEEHREVLVRVLEAPAYRLEAFWLTDRSGTSVVLVVEAALRLSGLARDRLVPSAELLRELRRVEPIRGVVLGEGPR